MSATLVDAKDLVWNRWATLDLSALHTQVEFHGPAPVGELTGRDAVSEHFFTPILTSLKAAQWEPHLFLAGLSNHLLGGLSNGRLDGLSAASTSGLFDGLSNSATSSLANSETWVASTGYLRGEPVAPLFGVPPMTNHARLRYGEFCRIEDGIIVEVRFLFDLVGYAAQNGFELLPPFPAVSTIAPPVANNGIVRALSDEIETSRTLQLVENMLGGCNQLVDSDLESMGMEAYWHYDMVWHGPWGIGSCYGFSEFQDYAQGPSVASFPNRRGGFHRTRFADGVTAAFTGWPSLQGTFDGVPFRGIEPTGESIGQNIMDFYIRRDARLHENWVLIDLIDFAAQCGVDLLRRFKND